ncbi:hypothetical protein ACEN9X_02340 [Mucilaginibacter sp. Mucisp86]|uniref:hypothetical protein n=1 Tax=Mucilaginibacter sp. Mucisp86 TaxID=3243060 RepID=UPI0039B5C5D4
MKNKKPNKLDQFILTLASEFAKIPDYEKKMQDADLKKIHTFVSVGILSIHDAANLVINSFIPAANKSVFETKTMIQHSMFKNIFDELDYDPNTTQQETIRLGYVFVFHKFEVFVNQLMEIMDETAGEAPFCLKKYCKSKFGFNANDWFRNSAVHLVNFISNCTKHQDGLCRLGNPAYSLPHEFMNHSPDKKIVRTTQQFRADIKALTDMIKPLIDIITAIFVFRTVETAMTMLTDDLADPMFNASLTLLKAQQEAVININITRYQL